MFYYFLFTAVLGLTVGISSIKELTSYELIMALLMALTGLIYQFSLTYSLKLIQIRIVSPIMLFSVVFSAIMDWFLKLTPIGLPFIIGAIIMALGIIGVIRFNK
ncbi:hypothetical protein fh0823_07970 [Francisella halioticida]|uniref:EamA domain-containing protein n=1 Tax=Francisella halioticida TaxID=549298 RepID=A0ABN5AVX3_9GAMM|nr:EamA family transporter [Francisella halioticida]ASG67860.1 hypothetical protein CDV26_05180 [Francisella halioticida]BCD90658.1 hypothetical protein fh0823_07970 [Francisella halioticida]